MSHIAAVRASRAGCIAGEGENEFKSILLTTPTWALFSGDLILFLDCYRLHAVQMDSLALMSNSLIIIYTRVLEYVFTLCRKTIIAYGFMG